MRKKEERREAGEREREREREKEWNILMREERECNKKIFFFLALSYSAHLKIDVHCS